MYSHDALQCSVCCFNVMLYSLGLLLTVITVKWQHFTSQIKHKPPVHRKACVKQSKPYALTFQVIRSQPGWKYQQSLVNIYWELNPDFLAELLPGVQYCEHWKLYLQLSLTIQQDRIRPCKTLSTPPSRNAQEMRALGTKQIIPILYDINFWLMAVVLCPHSIISINLYPQYWKLLREHQLQLIKNTRLNLLWGKFPFHNWHVCSWLHFPISWCVRFPLVLRGVLSL